MPDEKPSPTQNVQLSGVGSRRTKIIGIIVAVAVGVVILVFLSFANR